MYNLTYSLSKDGNLSTWTLLVPLALVLLQSQPQHHSELCPILEILQLLFLLHRRGLVVRGREVGRKGSGKEGTEEEREGVMAY